MSHAITRPHCMLCGTEEGAMVWNSVDELLCCQSCQPHIGSCTTCAHNECNLRVNPLNLQVVIPKIVRQGNMQIQTQEVNPAAIEAYCQPDKCKCKFNDTCFQNVGCCDYYEFNKTIIKE